MVIEVTVSLYITPKILSPFTIDDYECNIKADS